MDQTTSANLTARPIDYFYTRHVFFLFDLEVQPVKYLVYLKSVNERNRNDQVTATLQRVVVAGRKRSI